MPVSPADFEFYSRMTGQPVPNTPAGRMAIAPQVYNMRRGGGGFGRMLTGAARGALAAGALAGAGALALAVDEDKKVAKQQKATRRKGESFLQELQAQGAKEREATEYAQQMLAEDSKAYRGMVRDAGENVIADLRAEGRPSASSEAAIPSDAQGFRPGAAVSTSTDASVYDDPNVLYGVTPEQRAKAKKFLANRISHQSAVPQADTNTEFESRAAQIASTSEPTQPRVEVRQQPSSGAQVTDLSNVAAKDYSVGKIEPGTEMITNREDNQLAPRPFTQKEANTRIVGLIIEGIEQLEGGQPSIQFPEGEGSKYESMTLDPSGDINVKFRKGDNTYSYPQTPEASEGFAQLAGMYNNPGPATASPFVTDKGKEIGALLSRAQKKKINPREQQIRSDVDKSLGLYTPEQKEAEVQRRLGQ